MTGTMLTSRERVNNGIAHQWIDRIPRGELCITDDLICGCTDRPASFDEQLDFIQGLGLDMVSVTPCLPYSPDLIPSPDEFELPDLDRWTKTDLFTFAILDGAFEWGMKMFGLETFLTMVMRSPDSVLAVVKMVETFNLSMIERLASEGVDLVLLADDIAHQNGLFVSGDILRGVFIPSLARQVDAVRAQNLPVFFHSDGNYLAVVGDIVEAGFSGLQCLEKGAGMRVADLRERFGEKIVLWGHLEVNDVASSADPAYLAGLIQEIRDLSAQGGFILGTTSGLFPGIDISLLQRIYDSLPGPANEPGLQ